jgi:hypothetical protein
MPWRSAPGANGTYVPHPTGLDVERPSTTWASHTDTLFDRWIGVEVVHSLPATLSDSLGNTVTPATVESLLSPWDRAAPAQRRVLRAGALEECGE